MTKSCRVIMNISKLLYAGLAAVALVGCSEWTEPKPETYANQDGLKRFIPLLEAQGEEDLSPSVAEYYAKVREYRKTPHVMGFGWFGNWTGKGDNPMRYLKALPDSVDFVSLWGTRGNLSEEQKSDLNFFQKVKGGKALLCWIVQDIGDQLTPTGETAQSYWVEKLGNGNPQEAARAYARAICDTIEKYNLDGFDIDYEAGYGHHSRNTAAPIAVRGQIIGTGEGENATMHAFIDELHKRLKPAGRLLVMDGEPNLLSTETSKLVDYYIYQAYYESSTYAARSKMNQPHLDNYVRKTILTVEFEKYWRQGGVAYYSSERAEIPYASQGAQLFDYATLEVDGVRIAGVGTYHMEYDIEGGPYRWLRAALHFGNVVLPATYN